MTSLFRPLLSSLLCCVIAFGQLPTLLHVVTCHGHAHSQRPDEEPKGSCSHGCHHHLAHKQQAVKSAQAAKSNVEEGEETPAVPEHDSEHCPICHSLANPVGFVWNFDLPLVPECLNEFASICADRLPVKASYAIPQPRGPPVVA